MKIIAYRKLVQWYCQNKKNQPEFSLRAMARALKLQPSALSEIINGKRTISENMAKKILAGLGHSEQDIEALSNQNGHRPELLDLTTFKIISDWYYFAILSLAETRDFDSDPKTIGQRLNISESMAADAIERLLELKLLQLDAQEKLIPTYKNLTTPSDTADDSLKIHTVQSLELAETSLFRDPVEMREFTTVTMAVDPKKLKEAKQLITEFKRRITHFLEAGQQTRVYKLSIQLFPLDQVEQTENNL